MLILMQVPVSSLRRWNIQHVDLQAQPPHFPIPWSHSNLALLTDIRPEAQKSKPRARAMFRHWYIIVLFFQPVFELFILTLPQESQLKNWPF